RTALRPFQLSIASLTQLSQLNGQNYRKARKSRPLIQRSPLRRPAGTGSDSAAGGCNPGWRLRWQGEVQLRHEHLLLHWQLGVAGQHQRATVGGRETDVEHPDRGHLMEHGRRGEPRRQSLEAGTERDVETIGHEGDEDVSLNSMFQLVMDGAEREIVFESLKGSLHFDELDIELPEFGRVAIH